MDCSSLFIEGQKVSAVAKSMARSLDDARQRGVLDFDYRLDLYRLMALLRQAQGETKAVVFGSVTDSNEGLWRHAVNAGFEVITVERGFSGKEKRVDTSLATRMCRDAYRRRAGGTAYLSDAHAPTVLPAAAQTARITVRGAAIVLLVAREAVDGQADLPPAVDALRMALIQGGAARPAFGPSAPRQPREGTK